MSRGQIAAEAAALAAGTADGSGLGADEGLAMALGGATARRPPTGDATPDSKKVPSGSAPCQRHAGQGPSPTPAAGVRSSPQVGEAPATG